MCGICGKLSLRKPDFSLIRAMTAQIAHRGPDDEGCYVDNDVALGHRRLAILDLSYAGHQPMANEDRRLRIVYNGEVYNYLEIRDSLAGLGHRFRSNTDTEVVLKAYEQWGPDCLRRFNGMFALAIWDRAGRTLFLARDRMGIKPLYYYLTDAELLFASEIKALLVDPRVPREIDPAGLATYLTFSHSMAPRTIFRDVRKLPPGHFMLCARRDDRRLDARIGRYWSAPMPGQGRDRGKGYYVSGLREVLRDSVKRHLIADVPVGVFLSGGIDSSAVTAIASQMVQRPISTFSIGFDSNEGGYDELADARTVARRFGTDHHELVLLEDDLLNALDDLTYQYDEPFGDAAAFPTYLLARFARATVPVALSGEGSDEIFGGYRRYVLERWAERYRRLPGKLHQALDYLANGSRISVPGRVSRAIVALRRSNPLERYLSWLTVFSDDLRAELVSDQWSGARSGDGVATYSSLFSQEAPSIVDKLLLIDQLTWLPDTYLEKVDKATMAVGLEARVPFLDHEVVEFAAAIPAKYKVRGLDTKHILKESLKGVLPAATLKKPKHGFDVPLTPWFRGKLKERMREVLFDSRALSRGFFDYGFIERIYRLHTEGAGNYYKHLWLLIVFEKWCQQYLDRPIAGPGAVAHSQAGGQAAASG